LIVQGAAENETITLGATILPAIEPRRQDFIKIAAG
jgi:hypothetical protein